jgi:hypothetical protein
MVFELRELFYILTTNHQNTLSRTQDSNAIAFDAGYLQEQARHLYQRQLFVILILANGDMRLSPYLPTFKAIFAFILKDDCVIDIAVLAFLFIASCFC